MTPAARSSLTGPPRRLGRFEWVLFLLVAGLLAYQVCLRPIVGLADNGDYGRIMEPLGLGHVGANYEDRYDYWVHRQYVVASRDPVYVLPTSELLLAGVAKAVHTLFFREELFDLRVLGSVHLSFYLLGLYLILATAQSFSYVTRAVVGLGVLLTAPDVAYMAYLNSFYTETASLIFLLILLGLALRNVRTQQPSRWLTTAYFVSAALLVSAKPQNYALALPLAVLPVWLLLQPERRKMWPLVCSLGGALLLLGVVLFGTTPRAFRVPVLWDTLFYSILPISPSPERDLAEFGLEPELADWAGIDSWGAMEVNGKSVGPPVHETTARYGFREIAFFYLRHPGRLVSLASLCAEQAFVWREPSLGNYTSDSGHEPGEHARSVTGWSDFENMFFPKSLVFLASFFVLYLAACVWELRKGFATPAGRTAALCFIVGTTAVLQFAVVVMSEGLKDLVKHLFLFQVLVDVCLVAFLAWTADRITSQLPWGWWRNAAVPDGVDDANQ